MSRDLTPKERNRVRRIRDLLEAYESSPPSRHMYVVAMKDALEELDQANTEAYAERREAGQEQLKQSMESLKVMGESSPQPAGVYIDGVRVTKEQQQDMEDAHAQGLHDDLPREGCPECERKRGRVGP